MTARPLPTSAMATRPKQRPALTEDAIADFWQHAFPYEAVTKLLGLGGADGTLLLEQRFALFSRDMAVQGAHAHFATLAEWKQAMVPPVARVELGARVDQSGQGRPLNAPLVFDLDADDYAGIMLAEKVPDKATPMNEDAWAQMALSAALLHLWIRHVLLGSEGDATLRVLAVFSGRRGIHMWYPNLHRDWSNSCDTEAMVVAIGRLSQPHHASTFRELLVLQNDAASLLAQAAQWAERALQSPRFFARIAANETLHAFFQSLKHERLGNPQYRARLETAGLLLFAPRIDTEVTKSFTHLVKAPFSVHPATGNVCMPFRPRAPPPKLVEVSLSIHDPHCAERLKRAVETASC